MARKHKHEDHQNHEAWAIPYGDLITLLLAFFVVMYAISSVNQGKYRVLSDSLSEAFGGPPRSIRPIQLGLTQVRGSDPDRAPPTPINSARGPVAPVPLRDWPGLPKISRQLQANLPQPVAAADRHQVMQAQERLAEISREIEKALGGLIEKDLVTVRRTDLWVEVEIKSDILFPSGSAVPTPEAMEALMALATALQPFPNGVRVEGHTDDVPIATAQFPSNWELSTARAASVVHIFEDHGVASQRLTVVGYGEQRPLADNATAEGRNANRRVMIVILAELVDNPAGESIMTGLEGLQPLPAPGEPEAAGPQADEQEATDGAAPGAVEPETVPNEREI